MPFFIDTSALFKRYQIDKGTATVTQILEARDQTLYISSITIIEIISNLKRLCEVDKLTSEDQFHQQRDFFYKDIQALNMTILDVTSEDVIKAEDLMLKRYMKPIDSIQLAITLDMQAHDIIFISADRKLCKIAAEEGLKTVTI